MNKTYYDICPHPESNGVAERMNRTHRENARAMMKEDDMTQQYCGEAVKHAAYL